jgi:hypothetical protein
MQTADCGQLDDRAVRYRLGASRLGRVLGEAEMRSRAMVVREVVREKVSEMARIPDDHVVKALATNRSDQAFDGGVLPRRAGGREYLGHRESGHPAAELVPIDAIPIAQEEPWRAVPRQSIDELLRRPRAGGVLGDVEVDHATPVMREDVSTDSWWRSARFSSASARRVVSADRRLAMMVARMLSTPAVC